MTRLHTCPTCGVPVSRGSPFGMCPSCLRQSALTTGKPEEEPRSGDLESEMLVGGYRLLRKIGEGGFGEVYEAEQKFPVRRRVALKLLKRGMDSRQVVARFEAERQALALMDHPHVAKVFDGGESADGRPYFVMELVEGMPISEYCESHDMALRERLELFMRVCEGVQHAHSKGIIHRDLKPSNVLVGTVDGKALPKVIDFGVAKATNHTLTTKTVFTAWGSAVGTPVYMSPEQAAQRDGDIDTRTDVYSLGVVLYELLTGSTPFDAERLRAAGHREMERILCEEEPAPPSVRLKSMNTERKNWQLVRGDLDWIVMRALEKGPVRRYDTAIGLAKDVRRFLADEAVEAGPPTRMYLLRKFARRNRAALVAATLVALALVTGTIVSTWQAVRATRAETEATRQSERAREAELTARQEAEVGNTLTALLTEKVVVKAFAGGAISLPELLAAIAEVEARLASLEDQPLVQAGGYLLLSRVHAGWNMPEQSVHYGRRSADLYRDHLGGLHPKRLEAAAVLLGQLIVLEEFGEVEALLSELLGPSEALYGVKHPQVRELLALQAEFLGKRDRPVERIDGLRKLVAAHPMEQSNWLALGDCYRILCRTALEEDRGSEAIDHLLCAAALVALTNTQGGFWQSGSKSWTRPLRKQLIDGGHIPKSWMEHAVMFREMDVDGVLDDLALSSPAHELVHSVLLERRGEPETALEILEAVVENEPEGHLIRHAYGLKLELNGKEREAVEELKAAMLSAARAEDLPRVRWYAANWNRLRVKLGLPLNALEFPRSEPMVDSETGHCYCRVDIPLPWHDARRACEELGGHLAVVTSEREDTLLARSFAVKHMCWLGASDHQFEGDWRWLDGTKMTYQAWDRGQPSNDAPDEHYLAVGRMEPVQILGRTFSWDLSGWYDQPGHGMMGPYEGNPMGNNCVTYPLCEWMSEAEWRMGTRRE